MNPLHMPSFAPRFLPSWTRAKRPCTHSDRGSRRETASGAGPGGGGVVGRGRGGAAGPFVPPCVELRHMVRVAIHLATSRSPPGDVTGHGRKVHRSLRTVSGGPAPAFVSPPEERLYEQLRVADFYNCECLLLVSSRIVALCLLQDIFFFRPNIKKKNKNELKLFLSSFLLLLLQDQ